MLSDTELKQIKSYRELLLIWYKVIEIDDIKALERRKWKNLDALARARKYLLDHTSAIILLILGSNSAGVSLMDIVNGISEPGPEDNKKQKRKAYERSRSRILRLLGYLKEYELIVIKQPNLDNKEYLISGSPLLYDVLKKFIPMLVDGRTTVDAIPVSSADMCPEKHGY